MAGYCSRSPGLVNKAPYCNTDAWLLNQVQGLIFLNQNKYNEEGS